MNRGKTGLFALAVATLVFVLGTSATSVAGPLIDPYHHQWRKTVDLRKQISLFNLVNGLDLTSSQLHHLIDLLTQARRIRQAATQAFMAMAAQRMIVYKRLRHRLVSSAGDLPRRIKRQVHQMNRLDRDLRDYYMTRMRALEKRIEAVLKPHQKYLVGLFRPCIIPPKDIRGPARVGANASPAPVPRHLFKKLRSIPEDWFQRAVWIAARRVKDRLERRFGVLPRKYQSGEIKRLVGIMTRVRRLNAAEYEINKARLAKAIYEPYNVHKRIVRRRKKGQPGLVGRYFLQPQMLRVLRMKARRLQAKGRVNVRP